MAEELVMPPMGQTSSTLTLLEWRKKPGDTIKQGDVIAEVETDKATLDVESYLAGTIIKLLFAAGDTVEVGEPIAVIGSAEEATAGDARDMGSLPKASDSASNAASSAPSIPGPRSSSAASTAGAGPIPGSRRPGPGKVLASPVARQVARQRGVDINTLSGSGPGGRVTKDDVLAAAGAVSGPATTVPAPSSSVSAKSSDRAVIARRVAQSFSTIPHIYFTTTVDMSMAQRRLELERAGSKVRITMTHMILSAIGNAVTAHPAVNATWRGESTVPVGKANVGLVVATDRGLSIVTITDPGSAQLAKLAGDVAAAVDRARSGRLSGSDVAPAAVSVSNLGMFEVDEFLPIIDADQCCMIGIGSITERVVAINGAIAIRPQMTVSVAADHRVADGVDVAKFLTTLKQNLEARGDG